MLADRQQAKQLARWLDPVIRGVDSLVGEKVAMLVEVEYEGGRVYSPQGGVKDQGTNEWMSHEGNVEGEWVVEGGVVWGGGRQWLAGSVRSTGVRGDKGYKERPAC